MSGKVMIQRIVMLFLTGNTERLFSHTENTCKWRNAEKILAMRALLEKISGLLRSPELTMVYFTWLEPYYSLWAWKPEVMVDWCT